MRFAPCTDALAGVDAFSSSRPPLLAPRIRFVAPSHRHRPSPSRSATLPRWRRIALVQSGEVSLLPVAVACSHSGMACRFFAQPATLAQQWRRDPFDLVVVRAEATDSASRPLWHRLRALLPDAAVVIIAPDRDQRLIVEALDEGIDDCIAETDGAHAVVWRLTAAIRRRQLATEHDGWLQHGPYRFDLHSLQAYSGLQRVPLTLKGFGLAVCLFRHLNTDVSRTYLQDLFWPGHASPPGAGSLPVFVTELRKRLGLSRANSCYIQASRSVGYRLVDRD